MILANIIWILLSGLHLKLTLKQKTEPNSVHKKINTVKISSVFHFHPLILFGNWWNWFPLPAVPHTGPDDQGRRRVLSRHFTPVAFQIVLSDRFLSLSGEKKSIFLIPKHFFHKENPGVSSLQKQKLHFPRVLPTGTEEEWVKCAGEILAGIIKRLS